MNTFYFILFNCVIVTAQNSLIFNEFMKKEENNSKQNELNQTNKQRKRKQLNYDKTKTSQKLNKQRSSGTIIRTAKTTTTTTKKP